MRFIVKNTTFLSPLALLLPHSCRGCGAIGEAVCECCKKDIILKHENYCPNCKEINPTGKCKNCKKLPPIFVINERKSLVGDLIHDYKYNSNRSLARPLAEILNETLPIIEGEVVIVPLPTINRHIRERSFDHTFLLAKKLAKIRDYRVEKVLLRNKNTVQVGTDEKTRIKQASEAFRINENIEVKSDKTYILLDDVWTTGASMKVAIKKLREAGAKKIIVSILAVNRLK